MTLCHKQVRWHSPSYQRGKKKQKNIFWRKCLPHKRVLFVQMLKKSSWVVDRCNVTHIFQFVCVVRLRWSQWFLRAGWLLNSHVRQMSHTACYWGEEGRHALQMPVTNREPRRVFRTAIDLSLFKFWLSPSLWSSTATHKTTQRELRKNEKEWEGMTNRLKYAQESITSL